MDTCTAGRGCSPSSQRPRAARRASVPAGTVLPDLPDPGRLSAILTAAREGLWRAGGRAAERLALLQSIVEALRAGEWPPFAALAERAGLSVRTGWRRLAELERDGWVERVRRMRGRAQTSNALRVKAPTDPPEWQHHRATQRALDGVAEPPPQVCQTGAPVSHLQGSEMPPVEVKGVHCVDHGYAAPHRGHEGGGGPGPRGPVLVVRVPRDLALGWGWGDARRRVQAAVRAGWRLGCWVRVEPRLPAVAGVRITVAGPDDHPRRAAVLRVAEALFAGRYVERWLRTAA